MFCRSCGNQLPEGTTVCPKCGMQMMMEGSSFNTEMQLQDESGITFADRKERVVASIGGRDTSRKNYCIVTDKRVYFKGKGIRTTKSELTEKNIGLQDVTAVSFNTERMSKAMLILLLMIPIILTIAALNDLESDIAMPMLFAGLVLAFIVIIIYACSKKTQYRIDHVGGPLIFSVDEKCSVQRLKAFQQAVCLAKDQYILSCKEVDSTLL